MSTIVEVTGPDKTVEITTDAYVIGSDGNLTKLQNILDDFHAVVPLASILFEQQQAGPPAEYSLTLVAQDGREWYQAIVFDVINNPASTFVTGDDSWRLSELMPRRVLQKFLFDIVPLWSPLEITVTWL